MAEAKPGLFAGATRAKGYEETHPQFAAVAPGARRPRDEGNEAESAGLLDAAPAQGESGATSRHGHDVVLATPVSGPALLDVAPPTAVPLATTGWRAGVRTASLGLIKPKATPHELRHLEDLRVIRQATWTRAVNILVANERGGVGTTSTALIVGGLLGSYRGGYVAIYEATQSRGTLMERSEGRPVRGLAELLSHAGEVHTAGAVGGFTAPQTSHADVIGSVGERDQLSGYDVHSVRQVLDLFYRVTVTDSGSNHHAGAWLAAVDTADALVVPVMPRRLAVHGAMRTLDAVGARGDVGRRLCQHATAIITHDGGEEDKQLVERLPDELRRLGFAHVVEVPYDAHIRAEGELSIGNLSPASVDAWTHATACVVDTLLDAPEASPVQSTSPQTPPGISPTHQGETE